MVAFYTKLVWHMKNRVHYTIKIEDRTKIHTYILTSLRDFHHLQSRFVMQCNAEVIHRVYKIVKINVRHCLIKPKRTKCFF